jgi:hypothetical protein
MSVVIGNGSKMDLAFAQIIGYALSHLDGWPDDKAGERDEFGCCTECCGACGGLKTLRDKGVLDDVLRPLIEDDTDLHYAWWVDDAVSPDWLAIGWRETIFHPHHHLPRQPCTDDDAAVDVP